jgi:hypothetical protein
MWQNKWATVCTVQNPYIFLIGEAFPYSEKPTGIEM